MVFIFFAIGFARSLKPKCASARKRGAVLGQPHPLLWGERTAWALAQPGLVQVQGPLVDPHLAGKSMLLPFLLSGALVVELILKAAQKAIVGLK